MIINAKMINIPPYISTTWKQVESLHVRQSLEGSSILIVTLKNGIFIEVPNLNASKLKEVFHAHSLFLQTEEHITETKNTPLEAAGLDIGASLGFPLKFNLDGMGAGSIGAMMQHNPEQADAPNLPPEILQKISSIAHGLGVDEKDNHLPKAEPHCNCMYCQIARAIGGEAKQEKASVLEEEEVLDSELLFKDWDVELVTDKLYNVANPLDTAEQYRVYLGDPIGCTCGHSNCEHIKVVLKS